MSNVMISKSDFTITVRKDGGRITSTAPMTVKNQIREIRGIDDFENVDTTQKQDGATFIYNATTGKYEVKLYNDDPLLNVQNLYVSSLWANNSRGANGQVLFTNGNTIYWANGVTRVTAGTGLTGGGTGENVVLSVNAAYIATITSNNATFAYGKREGDLSVNFADFAGDANFAFLANNTTFAYGKPEANLVVQFARLAGVSNTANLATLANNSTFAYGKREGDLSVNFAEFSGDANFAFTANNSTFAYGKTEANLNVNSAAFAFSAALANTGVTPGTYGGPSEIPVITVDQFGRINAISFSAVAGVIDYNYSSANNTFIIQTGDGAVFKAAINSVKDFAITGNLTVSGTTTTVNTQNLTVKDPIITLNDGQLTPFNDIGIVMQRYAVANSTNYNVSIAWDETDRKLKFGRVPQDGSNSQITFAQEWLSVNETGTAVFLANTQAGNSVIAGTSMVINNVSFTERNYPGEANTATFFNGIIDCGVY
ncbi:hypothetical protein UFOVP447_73 [uncultured Caudovirales phage]|uniref:Uncharacterized protein n=1 Tax=uncultured Caudovirales phage TaxID=2100421 RepID=A0A6J5MAB6_9CAUD|nr:hypothetical protein UFOVP447_73 [uncultured Caudovirales phage]